MSFSYKMMPSPVGELRLVASDTGVSALVWKVHRHEALPGETRNTTRNTATCSRQRNS